MKKKDKHIKDIIHCSIYQAMDNNVRPYTIEKNEEVVEIILDGKVFFTDECGKENCYERGSIFWHECGEKTIHKTQIGHLYNCLSIGLLVDNNPRISSRIGFWNSPLSLDLFAKDILRLYHGKLLPMEYLIEYFAGTVFRQMLVKEYDYRKLPHILLKACNIIESDFCSYIEIKDLAKELKISDSGLFSLFKKHLNISPYKFILQKRLNKARELLASDGLSIKEVASNCGFEHIEVFYRQFKAVEKISPNQYRTKHQLPK